MSKKRKPFSVEYTSREVIANRLLASLEKSDQYAILVTKDDIQLLIDALDRAANPSQTFNYSSLSLESKKRFSDFRDDLEQFQRAIR